jgi:hypothetical protein
MENYEFFTNFYLSISNFKYMEQKGLVNLSF